MGIRTRIRIRCMKGERKKKRERGTNKRMEMTPLSPVVILVPLTI